MQGTRTLCPGSVSVRYDGWSARLYGALLGSARRSDLMPALFLANHAGLRSPTATSFATPLECPQWVASRHSPTRLDRADTASTATNGPEDWRLGGGEASKLRNARAAVRPALQFHLKPGQACAGSDGGADGGLGDFEAGADSALGSR